MCEETRTTSEAFRDDTGSYVFRADAVLHADERTWSDTGPADYLFFTELPVTSKRRRGGHDCRSVCNTTLPWSLRADCR